MRICKRFESASFENYKAETPEQKKLIAALKQGIESGFDKNILIIGGVGTGKTHLAYAVVNALAEKKTSSSGYRYYTESKVVYRSIKNIIDNIRAAWKDPEAAEMNAYCTCPVLIIDEIGVQYGTENERTELYEVFNRRYEDELPMIAISNHDKDSLLRILGQRIYDRLTGGALIFELTGKSFRQGGAND